MALLGEPDRLAVLQSFLGETKPQLRERAVQLEIEFCDKYNTYFPEGDNIMRGDWGSDYENLARAARVGGAKGGRIAGCAMKERGDGIFALGAAARGGRIGGRRRIELHGNPGIREGSRKGMSKMSREAKVRGGYTQGFASMKEGTGIFGLTPEQRKENSLKGHFVQKKNGIGVYGLTLEKRKEMGSRGAATIKKNGTGIYGLTPEHRSEIGLIAACQRWNINCGKPCICGYHKEEK